MKTKKFIVGLSTTALLAAMLAGPASAADANFVDINKSYAKDAIVELQAMGILNGMDATHFAPKGTLTRAQFTAIIVRALGLDASATVSSFSDVKGWAVGAVEAAAKAEIIEGIGNGMFAPNASLTRQEAATILVRALQLKGKLEEAEAVTFKDANKIADWAKPFIALAQHYGLIQGNPDGTFDPKGTTTREMAATMGMNLLGALDDVTPPVTGPGTVTPPVDTPPVVTPPVVTPPSNGGGGWYPPYTPPTTEPPTTEPPTTEPPVTEPPVTEPPAEVDTIIPVITLVGVSVVNVVYGAEYVDAGVTATDNKDGDLTAAVVTSITYGPDAAPIEAINTTVPDTYTINYNVSDAAGNAAAVVTRSVIVAAEEVEPPVVEQPTVINDVYLTSNSVIGSVYATVGDTVTLTFTTDEEVWKLGNFKINGSNPTSFESVQSGDTWTNRATYVIEESDPLGYMTFQINVKNAAGIFSQTVEATTDGSKIEVVELPVVIEPTVVSSVYTTWDGAERTVLSFELDKELDLATGDVAIKFLDVNGDEVAGANGSPVVKNKSWSGYLNNADGTVKYSVGAGEDADETNVNVLPANSILTTVITSASGYAGPEWFNAIATIQIDVVSATGTTSKTINMSGLDAAAYITTQDFSQTVTESVYSYDMGFKINLDKLSYDSIDTVTGTVYNDDTAVASVQITTPEQLANFIADDEIYGGTDGQLSFHFANEAELDGRTETSYLTYLIPATGPAYTHAELTIVTKSGIVLTVRYE